LLQLEPSSAVKPFNRDFFGDVGRFFSSFQHPEASPKEILDESTGTIEKVKCPTGIPSSKNFSGTCHLWLQAQFLASGAMDLVDILDPLDQDIFKSRLLLKNVSMGQNPGTLGE